MITQTLKLWLNKLFAWWPWSRSNHVNYSQATSSLNRGTTQELVWRTSVDGYIPQPGISSVAVEQEMDDSALESLRSSVDEYPERVSQPYQPEPDEALPALSSQTNVVQEPSLFPGDVAAVSSEEQHLTFLRYMVKRGIYNEGFIQGQEPEQYKQK
jgi:hypothetical protein